MEKQTSESGQVDEQQGSSVSDLRQGVYNRLAEQWQWSTNSMIDASEAHVMDGVGSFLELIRRAENYRNIPFDGLDKGKTYLFELVAPEQKIVIRYAYPCLYHIGTRSNITGQESNDDIGIRKPAEFPLHSLTECIRAAEALNQSGETIEHEGFVVVDANWHRIKVKSPEYVYAHRVASCHVFTRKRIFPMIRANDGSVEELIKTAPDSEVYVRYYQWRYAELKRAVSMAISKTRAMFEELGYDRKAIAAFLRDEPYQPFCFKAIGNNMSAAEILKSFPDHAVSRRIEDYQRVENSGKRREKSVPEVR